MRRTVVAAAVAATLLAAAAGCSRSSPSGTPTDASNVGTRSTASPSPTIATAALNQPFTFQQTFTDGTQPVDWQVTVTAAQCGLTVLPGAANNPDYTAGNLDAPERINATPAPGKMFCKVTATMNNAGTTPATATEDFGDLVMSGGQFQGADDDYQLTNNLRRDANTDQGVDPGDQVQQVQVWTVTAGQQLVALLFPSSTVYGGPAWRINVR